MLEMQLKVVKKHIMYAFGFKRKENYLAVKHRLVCCDFIVHMCVVSFLVIMSVQMLSFILSKLSRDYMYTSASAYTKVKKYVSQYLPRFS